MVAFCFFHQAWVLYPSSFLLPWSGRTPTTPCWLSHLGSPNFVYGKHSHIHFPNKHRLAGPSQFCQQLALLYLLSLPARSQSEVHCQHYLSQAGVRHQIDPHTWVKQERGSRRELRGGAWPKDSERIFFLLLCKTAVATIYKVHLLLQKIIPLFSSIFFRALPNIRNPHIHTFVYLLLICVSC